MNLINLKWTKVCLILVWSWWKSYHSYIEKNEQEPEPFITPMARIARFPINFRPNMSWFISPQEHQIFHFLFIHPFPPLSSFKRVVWPLYQRIHTISTHTTLIKFIFYTWWWYDDYIMILRKKRTGEKKIILLVSVCLCTHVHTQWWVMILAAPLYAYILNITNRKGGKIK